MSSPAAALVAPAAGARAVGVGESGVKAGRTKDGRVGGTRADRSQAHGRRARQEDKAVRDLGYRPQVDVDPCGGCRLRGNDDGFGVRTTTPGSPTGSGGSRGCNRWPRRAAPPGGARGGPEIGIRTALRRRFRPGTRAACDRRGLVDRRSDHNRDGGARPRQRRPRRRRRGAACVGRNSSPLVQKY